MCALLSTAADVIGAESAGGEPGGPRATRVCVVRDQIEFGNTGHPETIEVAVSRKAPRAGARRSQSRPQPYPLWKDRPSRCPLSSPRPSSKVQEACRCRRARAAGRRTRGRSEPRVARRTALCRRGTSGSSRAAAAEVGP